MQVARDREAERVLWAEESAVSKETPEIGKTYKVFLPGESPWAECVAVMAGGKWIGRIDNVTVASNSEARQHMAAQFGSPTPLQKLHDYKLNDLIVFEAVNVFDDVWNWLPTQQQIAGGSA